MTVRLLPFVFCFALAFAGPLGGQDNGAARALGQSEKPKNGKKLPRDPDAFAFLKSVMEADPGWAPDFPGFEAKIEVYWKGLLHTGSVKVQDRKRTAVELPHDEARAWVERVVAGIVAHGFRGDFDKEYANLGVTFGKDDLNPLGQPIEVHGGKLDTRYRIQDGQIRRENRANGDRRVTIDILDLRRDEEGRKLSQIYAVNYFDVKKQALTRSDTVREEKILVDGHLLPLRFQEIVSEGQGPQTRSIRFRDHQLLVPTR